MDCFVAVAPRNDVLVDNGSHLALAAIAQNKFEAEIDMARPGARQHQLRRGSADGIAVNADGAEAWRDQPTHFQIAEPNNSDRWRRGRTETQQSGGAQAGHEADGVRIIGREYPIDVRQ